MEDIDEYPQIKLCAIEGRRSVSAPCKREAPLAIFAHRIRLFGGIGCWPQKKSRIKSRSLAFVRSVSSNACLIRLLRRRHHRRSQVAVSYSIESKVYRQSGPFAHHYQNVSLAALYC